jgi:hypothetical protein
MSSDSFDCRRRSHIRCYLFELSIIRLMVGVVTVTQCMIGNSRFHAQIVGDHSNKHRRTGAAVRTRDSELAGGHGGESGELHCKLGHAVQIEPGLRPQSPKNGSFSNVRRRLSAISLRECPKSEPGDWCPIRKSPPLAGLSASIRDSFSERRTTWLAAQC